MWRKTRIYVHYLNAVKMQLQFHFMFLVSVSVAVHFVPALPMAKPPTNPGKTSRGIRKNHPFLYVLRK